MKYLCVHCDKTFVHDGDKKPRCPSCMRVNGLEEVALATKKSTTQPPWMWWAAIAVVLLAAGGGYTWWSGEAADAVGDEVPLRPLDRSAVVGHLRHVGVDARQLSTYLVPSDEVSEWAEEVADDAGSANESAAAIQAAIRQRASEGAFQRWSFGVPRETPLAAPNEVLEWLGEDGAHHHLYPIEVASLMATALRAQDVTAMVAEAIRFPGDRSPPDPSGQLGYYVVAVYPDDDTEGTPTYFDPYQGRDVPPDEARVLTDLQVIGAASSHRALHLMSRESDPERAMEASTLGTRLDGRSPSTRAVRGAILLVSGRPDEGLEELGAAKQLRPDAPRRNLLAGVHMAQGDLDAASREVSAALTQYPDFAPGRATLAAIHLARSETDLARTELNAAERIDSQLHLLPQLWAAYHASTGDLPRAVERAQQAVERNPDIQTRLMAARIYRQASRYDMMRREAHAILERAPSQNAAEYRELIRRMLGPTALEPMEDEDWGMDDSPVGAEVGAEVGAGVDDGAAGPSLGGSDLSLDSPVLGGQGGGLQLGGGGGGGPSLLGADTQLGGGGGGLQLGGGGGGLQLGGGDLQLGD